MEVNAGLVTGSHHRNEIVVIRRDGDSARRRELLQEMSGEICLICGDEVGFTADGEPFVACNDCAFPLCRTCYDYERREGSQLCPQCKTRLKRLKGCSRVEGDEEEDDIDDVENEFKFLGNVLLTADNAHGSFSNSINGQVPLLTYPQMTDTEIPPEQHALVPSLMGPGNESGGSRNSWSLPSTDQLSHRSRNRSLDPSKDLSAYGYGSVAWKERLETWKKKQEGKLKNENETNGYDGPDLPLMDESRQPLSRKMPVPSSQINPYRIVIIIRLVVLGFFFFTIW